MCVPSNLPFLLSLDAASLRTAGLLALLGAALLCSACGRDKSKTTFPVSGKVLFEDRPVANATIVLHPVGAGGPEDVKPRGTTGADGSFTLTTYAGSDGAPAGNYQVTVELWLTSGRGDQGPTSRLPAKYARPETSGLAATVDAGRTELQPLVLKR